MSGLLAAAWVTASFAAKGGSAHQVRVNYRRKTCEGMSVPFFAVCMSVVSRVAYGLEGGGLSVALSGAPGVLLSAVILGQYVFYDWRKR